MRNAIVSLFFLCLALFSVGCASNSSLIRDREYNESMALARQGLYKQSLDAFPKKEAGGFVTTVEKNYLGFWQGQASAKELEDQVNFFEKRKFISVSSEAKYFFFQEDEDGYVPAEHEVIVMHLLAAMIESQLGHIDDAKVEARRAGYFLQGFFNENQPHFDSPGLRLWLATIWAALGEWNEAQVDLRRAAEQTNDKGLLSLASQTRPPERLNLIFSGVGPSLNWSKHSFEPRFVAEPSPFDSEGKFNLTTSTSRVFSSHDWYVRHAERNSAIRDILMKSRYMSQFIGIESKTFSQRAGSKILTGGIKAVGVGLGLAIAGAGIYILANSVGGGTDKAAELALAAGIGVGSYVWSQSDRIDNRLQEEIDSSERESFADLRTYRFVRFLPDHVIFNWQAKDVHIPLATTIKLKGPDSKTEAQFIHAP